MIFAAACVVLAACTKTSSFMEGQLVTLNVNTQSSTKVTSVWTASGVDFKWQTGDKIKVSVGGASAEFTLVSGAGTASASFTGIMPAEGQTFDVQYPCTTPDLGSQAYSSSEAIPHDKMLFTATGCTLGTDFTLESCYSALELNLYGLNRVVSQIVVTRTDNPNESYTLTCSPAVRVGKSAATATPFCLVVPVGSWGFKVDVTSAAATTSLDDIPEYDEGLGYSGKGIIIPNNSFSTSSAKSFTAGVVQNMAAKSITIIWAPVNCGYKAADGEYKGYTYGRMYQWGRKYGHGYKDTSYEDDDYPRTTDIKDQTKVIFTKQEELLTSHPDGADYNGNFYCANFGTKNWYAGTDPDKLWNSNEGTGDSLSKSQYDPCPAGWRVPTKVELEILKGTKTSLAMIEDPQPHGTSMVYGSKFDGGDGTSSDNYVFLPIAGYIDAGGNSSKRGNNFGSIYYWSSTVDNNGKSYLLVKGGKSGLMVGVDSRSFGCSVRCVKE